MSTSQDRFSHSKAHCFGSLQVQPRQQVFRGAIPSLKYTQAKHFSQIQVSYWPVYIMSNRGLIDFARANFYHDYPRAYLINATTQHFWLRLSFFSF